MSMWKILADPIPLVGVSASRHRPAQTQAEMWPPIYFHSLCPREEEDAVWLRRKQNFFSPLSSKEGIAPRGSFLPEMLKWVFSIIQFPHTSHSVFTHSNLFLMALKPLFIIINNKRVDTMKPFQVGVLIITLQREIDPSLNLKKHDEDSLLPQ